MELAVIQRMKKGIAELVGSEPPTCPWRAFYDPLVMEVIPLSSYFENGNLAVKVGKDPPAVLLEALETYSVAKDSMVAHIKIKRHQRMEAQRRAALAKKH